MANKKFKVIRVSGVAVGVGFEEDLNGAGKFSENICSTLYDTGNDEKDAEESERWATVICNALNDYVKKVQTP